VSGAIPALVLGPVSGADGRYRVGGDGEPGEHVTHKGANG
jgi:hypothetical protein